MEKAILLAVTASLCTATSSVCQRKGARSSPVADFDLRLVFRLARQPVWLLGIASMILGFVATGPSSTRPGWHSQVRDAERLFGDPYYLVRVATADLASQALRDEEPAGLDPLGLVAAGPTWRLS